ncbi:hypothetical protein BASA61_006961 [Batrachochytrium salamandrivorans]|nr:hypothetical protein BASA60_006539 [Batrachochytrium salamandrivorans]KAH6585233.1 hypothetical protein BASA61_006961 [Batrachochytrium salamandrivorans]
MILLVAIGLVVLVHTVAAGPSSTCSTPSTRVEFRELTETQRQSYLNAVICLHNSPSKIPGIGSPSRFADIVRTHVMVLSTAHASAIFLPWHRAFVHAFITIMHDDCGYTGPMVYWDWSVDSQAPEASTLWSPTYFGGDGDPKNGYCVGTGPFSNYTSTFSRQMCLTRSIGGLGALGSSFSPEIVQLIVTTKKNFPDMHGSIEWGPHANIHEGVGGNMADVSMSTNDPIFMLHHCNVDRLWWMWQQYNPNLALTYSGTLSNGSAANAAEIMQLYGLLNASWPVSSLLDTKSGGPLCYQYSHSIAGGSGAQPNNVAVTSSQAPFSSPTSTSATTLQQQTTLSTASPSPTTTASSDSDSTFTWISILSTVQATSTVATSTAASSQGRATPSQLSGNVKPLPTARVAVSSSTWGKSHAYVLTLVALIPVALIWA